MFIAQRLIRTIFTIQQIFIELNISIGVRSSSVSQAALDNPARKYINQGLPGNTTIMTWCFSAAANQRLVYRPPKVDALLLK